MIPDISEAASDQAKERIGGEMLTSFGSNNGHGKPHHENIKSFKSGGYFRIYVYEKATRISRWLLGFVALRELLRNK